MLQKKRHPGIFALLIVAMLVLGACAPSSAGSSNQGGNAAPTASTSGSTGSSATGAPAGGSSASSGQKVTITFWNGFTGPDGPTLQKLVNSYNASHPNEQVQMNIQPWDTLLAKVPSAMSTGQGPDILAADSSYLAQYVQRGWMMDLSSWYQKGTDIDMANLPKGLQNAVTINGKQYAVPMNFATLMLYYNKDMFKAAGLDPNKPPTNWSEWQADILKLTKHSGGVDQYGLALAEHDTVPNWQIFIWGNGGDIVSNGKSALDNPKTIAALQEWGNLVTKDKITPVGLGGADADKLFQSQRAAMEVSGPWLTSGYVAAKLNFDVAPVPAGPAGPATAASSVLIMVNKNTKHLAAVKQFIEYWSAKDTQVQWSVGAGFPTYRLDLVNDPRLKQNPWVPKFTSQAPYAHFYLTGLPNASQIDTDIFTPMIQSITLGKATAQQAATQASQKLNQLLGSK
jgi:multiple sugar transport system substrate-binding protein